MLERVLLPVEGGAGEAHGTDGAGVSGHAARDRTHGVEIAGPVGGPEVGVVDEERGRRPHAAPAGGEDHGARGFLGGEAGDDVAEQVVREVADVVPAVTIMYGGPVGGGGGGVLGVGGREGEVVVVGVVGVGRGDEGRGEEGDDLGDDAVHAVLRGRALQCHVVEVLLDLGVVDKYFSLSSPCGGVHGGGARLGFCRRAGGRDLTSARRAG